jgi:hypothetical protein
MEYDDVQKVLATIDRLQGTCYLELCALCNMKMEQLVPIIDKLMNDKLVKVIPEPNGDISRFIVVRRHSRDLTPIDAVFCGGFLAIVFLLFLNFGAKHESRTSPTPQGAEAQPAERRQP